MLVCVYYCAFGTRDRGCSRHPAFPAPSGLRVRHKNLHDSGEIAPGDRGRILSPHVVPDKRATRAPIRDPYAAAEITRARWSTTLLQQLLTVVIGPGSRPGRRRVGAAVALAPRQADPSYPTIKSELRSAKVSRLNPRFSARSSPRADTLLASLAIAEEGRRHGTPGF